MSEESSRKVKKSKKNKKKKIEPAEGAERLHAGDGEFQKGKVASGLPHVRDHARKEG